MCSELLFVLYLAYNIILVFKTWQKPILYSIVKNQSPVIILLVNLGLCILNTETITDVL